MGWIENQQLLSDIFPDAKQGIKLSTITKIKFYNEL